MNWLSGTLSRTKSRLFALMGVALVVAAALVFSIRAEAGVTVSAPVRLAATQTLTPGEILDPPGASYSPGVTASATAAAAQKEESFSPSVPLTPILALFTEPGSRPVDANGDPTGPPKISSVPAWVIQGQACVSGESGITLGASASSAPCTVENVAVVYNSDTGVFIEEVVWPLS